MPQRSKRERENEDACDRLCVDIDYEVVVVDKHLRECVAFTNALIAEESEENANEAGNEERGGEGGRER
jgi:hypothetical protein